MARATRRQELWIEGSAYDVVGMERFIAPDHLVSMYEGDIHKSLIEGGLRPYLTATPRITLNGDTAEALAYSFVILTREWRLARLPRRREPLDSRAHLRGLADQGAL